MSGERPILRALINTDWQRVARVASEGLAVLRGLQGESTQQIVTATERAAARGELVRDQIQGLAERIGRAAVGCAAPASCNCPYCKSEV